MDEETQLFYDSYMNTELAKENGFIGPSDWGLSCYRCMKAALLGIADCAAAGADYTDSEVLTQYIKGIPGPTAPASMSSAIWTTS